MSILDTVSSDLSSLVNLESYFDQLYTASYNGVRFFTEGSTTVVGRRNAEHIYPFRDKPWLEDIGRKARRYHVTGFLVGDDCITQRDNMQKALEKKGPGVLVHPTYGRLTVSALDNCSFEENKTHGRVIKMNLVFEESGLKIYPNQSQSTSSNVSALSGSAFLATANDFLNEVGLGSVASGIVSSLPISPNQILGYVSTVQAFGNQVINAVTDAARLFNIASNIVGSFGRFFGSSAGSTLGSIVDSFLTPASIALGVTTAVQANTSNTASVISSVSATNLAATNSPASLPNNVQNIVSALATAIPNPADAIRIFTNLNSYAFASAVFGTSVAATVDLCRRAAAIALAQATATYVPISQNDAYSLMNSVASILDNEILIAGNQGQDQTFLALEKLRISVIKDLTARGSALAPLQTFINNSPMPATSLAYEYYGDITRTDQLINFANPKHPAFMPSSFQALSY